MARGSGKGMRKIGFAAITLLSLGFLTACGQIRSSGSGNAAYAQTNSPAETEQSPGIKSWEEQAKKPEDRERPAAMAEGNPVAYAKFPGELMEIPQEYKTAADHPGTLVTLNYDTYESMTYEKKSKILHKQAIVYLPYGYTEDQSYPVFYLMHGGWSNETTYLGIPDKEAVFKYVLDHAMGDGKIEPMIIVCPTYNNESGEDSGDYSLAIRLTDNYHNELIHDLIPAVEAKYSTYAEETTPEGIRASRDYRGFGGFSMGSVATWRTFQYCLDYFRYFTPSSGNLTSDGEYMASIVRESGYEWNDFFIFAASGTDDFAYPAFKHQIEAMAAVKDGTFQFADNERDGNLYFLEQDGGVHDHEYAIEYVYNGLCSLWKSSDKKNGFITGQIWDGEDGTIHYSYYLPAGYDPAKEYPLMVAMPDYDAMWFGEQSSGKNLDWRGALVWTEGEEEMIVVSAQLTDWGRNPQGRQSN